MTEVSTPDGIEKAQNMLIGIPETTKLAGDTDKIVALGSGTVEAKG